MSNKSNGSNQIISLPKGGGAQHGLGEKFSPDLHTGTGNFTVPIALPPGRNGFQPQLNLVYSTGHGNGPFGLGWSLSIPGITRQTAKGVPRYRDYDRELEKRDTFILSGAEDLVPVPGGPDGIHRYRPRTEGLFARIDHVVAGRNNHWRVSSKDGLVSTYGTPRPDGAPDNWQDPSVITDPVDKSKVFAWKLTETRDPFGNKILYKYLRDTEVQKAHHWDQLYLQEIRYVDYTDQAGAEQFLVSVTFEYGNPPPERLDAFSEYRAGFEIRTRWRCSRILIETHPTDGTLPVRAYELHYEQDPANGVSLLKRMEVVGFDERRVEARELPPLGFGYTRFEPEKRDFFPVMGKDLPARSLANQDLELVDLFGNGLPDILEMNGTVRYWRNLGDGSFDLPRPMREAPPVALAQPGVQLIDANGDGRTDLLVTLNGLSGYFPLRFGGLWDHKSFQKYERPPSFNLEDPEVRLVDLTGDGVTDVIRSGTRLECFFNDPQKGWLDNNTRWVERRDLDEFPNVNFSDPRVKWADMSGDGLQDIVLVYDGNVEYWPNLGYGSWGKRIHMTNSPRFSDSAYYLGYDPKRILIGDVDGDGLADIVYVDDRKVCLWINQSGNSWSDPVEIDGTPPVSDMDAVRLVDLLGTGISGVLWSSDFSALSRGHMFFLDLTGGVKPYLLNEMDNNMGAMTKVEYTPSTKFYLEDQKQPKTRWKTPLPFPVQTVSRVEVLDKISKGKLTTEYKYHHGYWDGAEREFRGFGMVEQLDTETFEDYNRPGLHGEETPFQKVEDQKRFSAPTFTKTWFHQGPLGDEFGGWEEPNYENEYWKDDPSLLERPSDVRQFLGSLPRRVKRDAIRALRGTVLRTELYALDDVAPERRERPYTVTESTYGVCEVVDDNGEPKLSCQPRPGDSAERLGNDFPQRIFFPHILAQRTTQWERGDDPMTQFTFTDDYDDFGQPLQQTVVAVPRRSTNRLSVTGAVVGAVDPNETRILATHTRTKYAPSEPAVYLHDRVCEVRSYELKNPPRVNESSPQAIKAVLKDQALAVIAVYQSFSNLGSGEVHLISHTLNYYDGLAFTGLRMDEAIRYGALTRSETLVFTDSELEAAYADRRPNYLGGGATLPQGAPTGFGGNLGYHLFSNDGVHEPGHYAETQRTQCDFQMPNSPEKRGMIVAIQDGLGRQTSIASDVFRLLPVTVTDAVGLETKANYDYRVLRPQRASDPNGNVTEFKFTPLGLLKETWVKGNPNKNEGDRERPSIRLEYNFRSFEQGGQPVSVHTIRHIHHDTETMVAQAERDEKIESYEYFDGFGRPIQTLTQAEERVFGLTGDDVGLPGKQGDPLRPAHAKKEPDRFVVSGWQIYDNKGRIIEKYEPFFDKGSAYRSPTSAQRRAKVTLWYDPRGQLIRTINPDGSEQRVLFGVPGSIANPDVTKAIDVEPTPWESYTYDPNDLAPLSRRPDGTSLQSRAPAAHHHTPTSTLIDALGRVVCQVLRNGPTPASDWFITRSEYDLRGNLLRVMDAFGRPSFQYAHDLANRPMRVQSIDAGLRTSVLDPLGNLAEYRDEKGSIVVKQYDALNRITHLWARDNAGQTTLTLRELIEYGDGSHTNQPQADRDANRDKNRLGKPYRHCDEAGLLTFEAYDFKGNLTQKIREVVKDSVIAAGTANRSAPGAANVLEKPGYQTDVRFDALNRVITVTYPTDANNHRAQLMPQYNRAGALEKVLVDNQPYVEQIAYNAKGQRVLVVYGNSVMTRYVYNSETFRLARLRTEQIHYTQNSATGIEEWTGAGGSTQDFAYLYDLAGNITAIDEHTPNCGITNGPHGRDRLVRSFAYDPLYRLTSADGRACKNISVPRPLQDQTRCGFYAAGAATANQNNAPDLVEHYTENYSYDPAGNMLELNYEALSGNWKRIFGMADLPNNQWRQAPNNRLTTLVNGSDTHRCQFDENGNLLHQDTDQHHTWDHADRMVGYRVQPNANSSASLEARYLYGADGMRVKKWVRKGNSATHDQSTVYIDGIFEHHKWTESGTPKENNHIHVMDNRNRIAIVRVGDRHPDDGGEKVQYHLGDHLGGSTVVMGGDDATSDDFINREEYFPYGDTSFGSFAKKRYRFSAKERDEESSLYYFGARYYEPSRGRWVSCDPAGVVDGQNLYVLCRNNPFCLNDSGGFQSSPPNAVEGKEKHQQSAKQQQWIGENIKIEASEEYNLENIVKGMVKGEDRNHIRVRQGFIQIDKNYEKPEDAFRWRLLKEIIESKENVIIRISKANDVQAARHSKRIGTGSPVQSEERRDLPLKAFGLTLPSKQLHRKTWGGLITETIELRKDANKKPVKDDQGKPIVESTGLTSLYEDTSVIYLSYLAVGIQPLAHELLGHFYLASRGVPFSHESDPENAPRDLSQVKPEYKLEKKHGILKPDEKPFEGRVWDFINEFVAQPPGKWR